MTAVASDPLPATANALLTALANDTTLPDGAIACPDLGLLAVTGPDARRFLQGYATCDIDALGIGIASPGGFCNQQGRLLSTFVATLDPAAPTSVLLLLPGERIEPTRALLAKYIVFSKAALTVPEVRVRLITGTRAGRDSDDPDATRIPGWRDDLAWQLTQPTTTLDTRDDLPSTLAESIAVHQGRAGIVESTALKFTPQALCLPDVGGVSFEKGCYLGQEVVARLQHRGRSKERLFRLGSTAADASAAPGRRIADADGRTVGSFVSHAVHGADRPSEALAVLRTDAVLPLRSAATETADPPAAEETAAWEALPLPYAIPSSEQG